MFLASCQVVHNRLSELQAKCNAAQERIHQFDRCIRAVADALEAPACGGVDTDTSDPYGTTAVLVGRAKELADRVKKADDRVRVLTDAIQKARKDMTLEQNFYSRPGQLLEHAINATPQQTAEQIERWHIEWMKTLPVVAHTWKLSPYGENIFSEKPISKLGDAPSYRNPIPLVAIPPLPKE